MIKQTFWNNFISKATLPTFVGWVKDSNAESKIYLYKYLDEKKYNSIIDMGCGTGTIHDGLHDRNMKLRYTGVDSCSFFLDDLTSRGVHVINSDIRNIEQLDANTYDITFGRHVLEHQDDFKELLHEMIRIGKKEALHIFFIKPTTIRTISFDPEKNLYHNTYSHREIDEFLQSNPKVNTHIWVDLNKDECALHIFNK